MKKKVLIWEITGFLVVCALSGVFHFIYDGVENKHGLDFSVR